MHFSNTQETIFSHLLFYCDLRIWLANLVALRDSLLVHIERKEANDFTSNASYSS